MKNRILLPLFLIAYSVFSAEYDNLPAPRPVPKQIEYQKGPFDPTVESLKKFKCPEWFRDAKFGIWSHWGPQCVPGRNDWYARHIYKEGHRQNKSHLKEYGHPSEFGYKDIIPLWKAEKFDPDRLMNLYAKAGAKFFCTMAVHHDNFDLWESTYHRWNAVNLGPKRDIVGEWAKSARKHGLKLAVSEHLAASWQWWRYNKLADKKGDKKGVPYDGNDSRYADLYYPDNQNPGKGWYAHKTPKWFRLMYYWRNRDLLDKYKPDLFYSDGGFAFKEYGRSLITHYYNSSANDNGGKVNVVYASKKFSSFGDAEFVDGTCVEDYERGIPDRIMPHPWMTDTSTRGWFYDANNKKPFMTANRIIQMLIDITSKNGCLLLNFVQYPDGTLVEPQEKILAQLAEWMQINGDGIFGTRPWKIFGENAKPVNAKNNFRMNQNKMKYDSNDIRFTEKEGALYAFVLAWPESGQVTIKSLAKENGINAIQEVLLLGHDQKLIWTQNETALSITLPNNKPSDFAICFKITGADLITPLGQQHEDKVRSSRCPIRERAPMVQESGTY